MKHMTITLFTVLVLLFGVGSGQWTATFADERDKDKPTEIIRLVEQVQT